MRPRRMPLAARTPDDVGVRHRGLASPTPTAWTWRVLAAAMALVFVASACSSSRDSTGDGSRSKTSSSDGSTADASDLDTRMVSNLKWSSCSEVPDGQCARLQVPLDWDDPGGGTVELALGRIPSGAKSRGAVLVNPGGPGASGLGLLRNSPISSAVSDVFDIVSWDPRGVGQSSPLKCGGSVRDLLSLDPDPDSISEQQALDQAAASVADECAATDKQLLSHMTTEDTARDLEAIRVALGESSLNYIGFSYGTHIGQVYAQLYPRKIRTMVLDGVVDPSEGFEEFLEGQTRAFEKAFAANANACRKAGVSTCGVKDLETSYDKVHKRVEKKPLGSGDSLVGPAQLATAAIMSAYWDDGWTALGPALAKALDGRPEALRKLADTYTDLAGYPAYAGVVCTDSPPPEGDAAYEKFAVRLREISPRLGGSIANELLPCATWPVKARRDAAPIAAEGSPPILVIGNTGDPATPYSNAADVAKTLSSGVLVTAEISGHTAYGSDSCVTRVVDSYIVDRVVPERDPRCT